MVTVVTMYTMEPFRGPLLDYIVPIVPIVTIVQIKRNEHEPGEARRAPLDG